MPLSPYYNLIQVYFPPDQWDNADIISVHECSPDRSGFPGSCVGPEGYIDCAGMRTTDFRSSYGPFQVFESCWNPAMNPRSPFTPAQWAQVLDPNMNIWMASVIWSSGGWGMWGTCGALNLCGVPGGPIPHPEGPVPLPSIPPPEPGPVPVPVPVPQPWPEWSPGGITGFPKNPGPYLFAGALLGLLGMLVYSEMKE